MNGELTLDEKKTYSYYPGCSLHSTGLEYGLSVRSVFQHLDLRLSELPDWNCCGASSAHALDHILALSLPARNLVLAQALGRDLVTPCAACYGRLKNTDYVLRTDSKMRARIEALIASKYTGEVAVRNVLSVLYEDYGAEKIAGNVRRPLTGLKVVPYYGCLLVRPPAVAQFDDPDQPHVMADLLSAAGAEVLQWSYATDCCGSSLSLSRPDIVNKLVDRLVERAREAGADALATACPLCQVNLEMRQSTRRSNEPNQGKMPTFYFTELLGLAFDLTDSHKWWGKHLIDPRPLLGSIGLMS